MAELTVQTLVSAGLTPSFASASVGGDLFANDDRTFLVAKNTSTGSNTVTIAKQRDVSVGGYGLLALADIVVIVPPTTGEKWIAVPPGAYNAGGKVQVTYSAVAGLTVAAVRRPQD